MAVPCILTRASAVPPPVGSKIWMPDRVTLTPRAVNGWPPDTEKPFVLSSWLTFQGTKSGLAGSVCQTVRTGVPGTTDSASARTTLNLVSSVRSNRKPPAAEPGRRVRSVARIADEHERAAGEPDQQHPQRATGGLGGRAVPAALGPVLVRRAVQVDQHGQDPRAGGERELHEDGQHHPPAAVPPGGVHVGRADRVAVPPLAVHLFAPVPVHGVVPDQHDRAAGDEVVEQEPHQDAAESEPGPPGRRGHLSVGGAVPGRQVPGRPQEVGDGPPSGGQDGRAEEGEEPGVGGLGGQRRERREQRPGVARVGLACHPDRL